MKAIEQAIEARALKLAESRLEDDRGLYEWALDAEITLRECAAALSALRSMPAEPVNDALNTLCKMLHSGEEVEGDDGLAMLVPMGLWNEAQEAIESLVGEDDTTPPPAPVLSDAEIDAITVAQWGDRVLPAAYRAYARAVEAEVIRRGGWQS